MEVEQNNPIEIRRVQALAGDKSFTVVLPRAYAVELGIQRGDYVILSIKGKQLILEKADISSADGNKK